MKSSLGELRVKAVIDNLRTIIYFVQAIANRLELSSDAQFELELAVEEACANIVNHAYGDDLEGDIHISVHLIDDILRLTITDWGLPFDPDSVTPFDLNAPVEDRIDGGMGLYFMQQLTDGVDRISVPGKPNQLTLSKKVSTALPRGRAFRREARELQAMHSVTESMAAGINLDELLDLIVNKLVETIDADRGTLYLVDEETNELWSKVLLEEEDVLPEIRIKIGEGISGHVAETGEAHNVVDAYAEPLFNRGFDEATGYKTNSILTVPMRNPQQKIIGVVQVLNKKGGAFTHRDERLLSAMAAQAAISIENARLYAQELQQRLIQRELETAHNIQESFLPEDIPPPPGWDIGTFWLPVQSVAGDFYDFVRLDDGRLALVIADVSGKGIPAALFMALTVTVLRFGINLKLSPVEVIHHANQVILANQRSRMFATVFIGYLVPETGELTYASAGHNPPVVYHAAQGECEYLNAPGVAVGVFETAEYVEKTTVLHPDDILVLYTDGITEIIDTVEDEFGEDRLENLIIKNADLSARELTHKIIATINAFAAEEGSVDDETLVIAKRHSVE